MDTKDLLQIARETIGKVTYCFAVTAAAGREEANARIIQPSALREDWSVGFMTNRRCRKVAEMEASGRLTLGYQYDPEAAYVALLGRPEIIDDVDAKRAVWRDESYRWHPGGPEDPDVVLVELVTDRIELWNLKRGVTPAPEGLNSAVLRRDGDGWVYGETSPPAA